MIAGGLVLCLAVAVGWFRWLPAYRPALGPGESYGIDVSSYQHAIDWQQAARQHISFAYIKATEGATWTDPRFAANWAGARAAGLPHGAYHFYSLCSTGAAQARHFLHVLPATPGGLPPAVDLELPGNCDRRPALRSVAAQLSDFLRLVRQSTGQTAVIYLGSEFAHRYPLALYPRHPLWRRSILRRPPGNWAIWQVSSFARIRGISTRVDLDVARASLIQGPSPPAPPAALAPPAASAPPAAPSVAIGA